MKVKWLQLSNSEDTATLKQHAFTARECKKRWTGEKYPGNKSICSKMFCSEDGEYAQDFEEMEDDGFNESIACKRCIQILKKVVEESETKYDN